VDGIVYADIGPSSFNRQSHQQHRPTLDADPIEYAQIKHKHVGKSSMSEKMQPSLRADISGIGMFS
jgi:hypothetical protein